jgi:hypothetical protein
MPTKVADVKVLTIVAPFELIWLNSFKLDMLEIGVRLIGTKLNELSE